MTDNTKIEWARHPVTGKGATWNPINGCSLVSEGCRHCYAARLAGTRLKHLPSRTGLARQNAAGEWKFTGEVRFNDKALTDPLHWRAPRGIFVCAHGDLFHENVPDEWIDRIFAVMALCPQHVFFVLTKRPERMKKYLGNNGTLGRVLALSSLWLANDGTTEVRHHDDGFDGLILPNVWLGTSIEDQPTADTRIPHLLATPAALRFVSAEPLLGPVDLNWVHFMRDCPPDCEYGGTDPSTGVFECRRCEDTGKTDELGLDWVIAGGESGPTARPSHPDWFRSLRDQCTAAGVPFFFKQWGEFVSVSEQAGSGRHHKFDDGATVRRIGRSNAVHTLDGVTHNAMPEAS